MEKLARSQNKDPIAMRTSEASGAQNSEENASGVSKATMIPQSTFKIFRRLPREIQDAIWECAVEQADPRIVEIRDFAYRHTPEVKYKYTSMFSSATPIPGILHACSNSRLHGLKRWELSFPRLNTCAKIFFDFETDLLYFGYRISDIDLFCGNRQLPQIESLRKIAFHYEHYEPIAELEEVPEENRAKVLHRMFPKLNELVLVEADVYYSWYGRDDLKDYDYKIFYPGLGRPDRGMNCVAFSPTHRDIRYDIAPEILRFYKQKGWDAPEVKYMDTIRTHPPYSKRGKTQINDDRSEDDDSWKV